MDTCENANANAGRCSAFSSNRWLTPSFITALFSLWNMRWYTHSSQDGEKSPPEDGESWRTRLSRDLRPVSRKLYYAICCHKRNVANLGCQSPLSQRACRSCWAQVESRESKKKKKKKMHYCKRQFTNIYFHKWKANIKIHSFKMNFSF